MADVADRCATIDPADLAPTDDRDLLAELDERALAIRSVVAACRRATWSALHEETGNYSAVARMWGVTPQNVRQAIAAPDRPR
ncbi:hypothetical protein [Nocardia xishanensis]|uniref:hypothetical protein n=1 Tax=Nocardia xishanensis TaxID=238964 RepID=UPI0012F4E67D|nr:hypothetical protein [Nocardia xishanensis]